ncbi:MAG: hypothetical protein RIA08_09870 [Roseovarius sp.]|uniref:hypothetical protein n=1 Tax=Roseovarius sp. TaxID=1486281 RepID=UPI0032EE97B5
MATAFQDVLTKLSAQKAALDGQMKAVECLEEARETLAGLGFDAAVSAKEGRLRLEVRLEPVRALPKPDETSGGSADPGLIADDVSPPEPVSHPGQGVQSSIVTGPFSDAEIQTIIKMYIEGAGPTRIAASLGRSVRSVESKIRRLGPQIEQAERAQVEAKLAVPVNTPELSNPPDQLPAIKFVVDGKKPAIEPSSDYITGPYSDDEKAAIERMVLDGFGADEIAASLGRRTGPVAMHVRRVKARQDAGRPAEGSGDPSTASPAQTAPPQPSPPQPSPRPSTVSERHIEKHLDKLGYQGDWAAARDLQLAEIIARGDGIATAGAVLRVKPDKARERWFALNTRRGDIDHQARLLRVLRRRASA